MSETQGHNPHFVLSTGVQQFKLLQTYQLGYGLRQLANWDYKGRSRSNYFAEFQDGTTKNLRVCYKNNLGYLEIWNFLVLINLYF